MKNNRFGPAIKPDHELKLVVVKVGFDQREASQLDAVRGHHTRAAHLRAAGLGIKLRQAPAPNSVTNWSESARIQACFTQINAHAHDLNQVKLNTGEEAAARELLVRSAEILADFKRFRAELLGSDFGDEG